MKYIWIVMILIAELIWCVYSVKDYIYCRKNFAHPIQHVEEYTAFFIIVHLIGLFAISLALWLEAKMG